MLKIRRWWDKLKFKNKFKFASVDSSNDFTI